MTQTLPTTKKSQTKCSQSTFTQKPTWKRHVSYGSRDGHIKETEERLMTKYHMGYSQLHKFLIRKEGGIQFSTPL